MLPGMVGMLGPLPGPWWEAWEHREKIFNKDGTKRPNGDSVILWNLDQHIDSLRNPEKPETSEITDEDIFCLKALLPAMMVYEPSERISSDKVMVSEYMRNWAGPALRELVGGSTP